MVTSRRQNDLHHGMVTPPKKRTLQVSVKTDCPRPGFEIVLKDSHLYDKYRMTIPAKLQKEFPSCPCNVILSRDGKKWVMLYTAEQGDRKTFDRSGWKQFVMDNKLEPLDSAKFTMVKRKRNIVRFDVKIVEGGEEGSSMLSPVIID